MKNGNKNEKPRKYLELKPKIQTDTLFSNRDCN